MDKVERLFLNRHYIPLKTAPIHSQHSKDIGPAFFDLLRYTPRLAALNPLETDDQKQNRTQNQVDYLAHIQTGLSTKAWLGKDLSVTDFQRLFLDTSSLYCEHLASREKKKNLYQIYIEADQQVPDLAFEHILKKAVRLKTLEKFLGIKFQGAKRFSIEGLEGLGCLLSFLLEYLLPLNTIKAVHFGMAHRGRLSIMTEVLQRPLRFLIDEFQKIVPPDRQTAPFGDVKYHGGLQHTVEYQGKFYDIILEYNPSHLESVNPVVLGRVRAALDAFKEKPTQRLPILIHGDASFTGQGIVSETLQMSRLKAYSVGGTIHIIADNQIGFTTLPEDTRSTWAASTLAEGIEAPILYANAEDPVALTRVMMTALRFRQTYQEDVVIHLYGYRYHGHQEIDDGSLTQPATKKLIQEHPFPHEMMLKHLQRHFPHQWQNISLDKYAEEALQEFNQIYETEGPPPHVPAMIQSDSTISLPPSASLEKLEALGKYLIPTGSDIHPKVKFFFDKRKEAYERGQNLDWGAVEALTYAYFMDHGISVRLVGQDAQRGTFAHRHAYWFSQKDNTPTSIFSQWPDRHHIYNSLLSEEAALAFEYGYSLFQPESLVLWEAQFGDFVNGAQNIIDLFLASGYEKWGQSSRLVLLLPHGYEGQGPEHTSARVERFLYLSANKELKIASVSNACQFFRLLNWHWQGTQKPLVLLTPKSLLRHKLMECQISDLIQPFTQLREVWSYPQNDTLRDTLLLSSGKMAIELMEACQKEEPQKIDSVYSVELLSPFPNQNVIQLLQSKPHIKQILWVQEEPVNQGILPLLRLMNFPWLSRMHILGRLPIASTTTTYPDEYEDERNKLIELALQGRAGIVGKPKSL